MDTSTRGGHLRHRPKAEGTNCVLVFGSTSRDDEMAARDIDVLVPMSERPSRSGLARIERQLAEVLATSRELVTETSLDSYLAGRIADESVVRVA